MANNCRLRGWLFATAFLLFSLCATNLRAWRCLGFHPPKRRPCRWAAPPVSSVPILLPEPQALIDTGYYGARRSDKMGKPLALRHRQSLRQVAQKWKQRKPLMRTAIPSDFEHLPTSQSGWPSGTHQPLVCQK